MSKEIIAVFQDCVLCGARGRARIAEYAEKGITIRKVSFASDEGRDLCLKAIESGVGSMPFYTDGKIFSTEMSRFLTKNNRSMRKNTNKRKEEKNGAISKNKR